MRYRAAGVILLTLCCAGSSAAESTPPAPLALVIRMSGAVRTANYDGVFIYTHAHQSDTLRIIHRGAPAPMRERLVSLTGIPREVIRDDHSVTTFSPETGSVMVEKAIPPNDLMQLPAPAQSIASQYTLSLAGTDRVAGRDAWMVTVQPHDTWRYGYRIWIDQDSYLPLRTEVHGLAGSAIEEIMFTQVSVLPRIDESDLAPGISGQGMTWFHGVAEAEDDARSVPSWHAAWMPPGFALSARARRMPVSSHEPMEQVVFSDGMASISIFIEKARGEPPQVGPGRVGAISTFARLSAGHQITAVGEVPVATVQRIANSMIPAMTPE